MIAGFWLIIKTLLHYDLLFHIISGTSYLVQVIRFSCLQSNVVQFNIDQPIGASGDMLNAIIYWHSLSLPAIFFIVMIVECLINQFIIVSYVQSGVAVSIVIITNFFIKHWLDNTSHIVNPVKLIVTVLNYARNCIALTYWEKNFPSRLDLGKDKYGGPFTEGQVDYVKVVIQLAPLLICIVGLTFAKDFKWTSFYQSDENLTFLHALSSKIHYTFSSFTFNFVLLINHIFLFSQLQFKYA